MKTIGISIILILCVSSVIIAAEGDVLDDRTTAAWQIVSSGLTTLITKMDGLPNAYQATQNINEWITWIRLEYAQSGSLGKIFPQEVYNWIVSRFIGYSYNNTTIKDEWKAPTCTAGVAEITCDEDTIASRDVICYAWDFTNFTEIAAGSLTSGEWTFTASAGNHVCTFDPVDGVPTTYLTVTE